MKMVHLKEIQSTLERGIKDFVELRDQWPKIVQFFHLTSNIMDVCLSKTGKKLTEHIEEATDRSVDGCALFFFTDLTVLDN